MLRLGTSSKYKSYIPAIPCILHTNICILVGYYLMLYRLNVYRTSSFVSPLRLIQAVRLDKINVCGCLPYVKGKQGFFDNSLVTFG
jgi:hypothetical protein